MSTLSDVNYLYFGVAPIPGSIDSNFVKNTIGSQGSIVSSKRQHVISYNTSAGSYMWYAYPQTYTGKPGDFIHVKTGIGGAFSVVATVSITTSFTTEYYSVWRSDYPNLGPVTISIQ